MGVRSEALFWLVLGLAFVSCGSGQALTCTNNPWRDFPMALKDGRVDGIRRIYLAAEGAQTDHYLELNTFLSETSKYCFRLRFGSQSGSDHLVRHEVSLRGVGVAASEAKRILTTDKRVCLNQIPSLYTNCCQRGLRIEGRAESEDAVFTGSLKVKLLCPVPRRPQKFVNNKRTLFYRSRYNSDETEKLTDMDFHDLTRVVVTERGNTGIQKVRFYKRNAVGEWEIRQTLTTKRVWRVYVKWATVVLVKYTKRMQIYHEVSEGVWERRLQVPTLFSRVGAAVQGRRLACLTAPDVVSVYVRNNAGNWGLGTQVRLTAAMDATDYSEFEPFSFDQDGSLIVLNMKEYVRNSRSRITAEVFKDVNGDGRTFRRVQEWDSVDGGAERFGHGGTAYAKGKFLFIPGANGYEAQDHPIWDVFRKNASGNYVFLQKLVPVHSGYPKRHFDYYAGRIYATETHLVVNDALILEPAAQPWKAWQAAAVYKLSSDGLWQYQATLRRNDRPEGSVDVDNLWINRVRRLMIDGRHVVAVMDREEKIYSWGPLF